MPTPTAFHVAPTDTGCVIRVQGRGTMKESPTVKAVAMQALVGDERTIVAIDLSTCDYLDSTFLARWWNCTTGLADQSQPDFWSRLLGRSERRCSIPRIDLIIPSTDSAPATRGDWVPIRVEPVGPRELSQHMMECHRSLSKFDSPMSGTFAKIADHLERELAKPKW